MDAAEIVGPLIPATFLIMLAIERIAPARRFPARRGWAWLGIAFLIMIGSIATVGPLLVDPTWLSAHRWIDGTRLGVAGGTLVGWLVLSGLSFAWHRTAHAVPLIWRLTHQLHHSPQRVDIPGSVLFHPLEMVVHTTLHTFATLIVLGLDPLAAALVGYIAAFHGFFQHWNINTPAWLGYFIQRPEAHCEHHRRGRHAGNYADLPLWDMLFGTFSNPARFQGDVGFEAPADRRLGAMLAFADANQALYGPASRGAARERA